MGKWDLLLPESALKELMLDKLLNRYLVITLCSQTLHNNAVYACRKVFQFNIFNVECVYFCCPCTCLDTSLVVYCPSLMFFCLISHFLSLSLCLLQIADSLPLSWFKGENVCLPQLQNFRNHLVQKVHTMCKQQAPEDPNTR